MYVCMYVCISITVVTIIIATILTLETLFSVTTRSRQIEKRLFLQTTFGTSTIYRVYLVTRPNIDVTRPNILTFRARTESHS